MLNWILKLFYPICVILKIDYWSFFLFWTGILLTKLKTLLQYVLNQHRINVLIFKLLCVFQNFVDLAGSEKASENSGDRFREGCAINKSLLVLSNVIRILSEGQRFGTFRMNYNSEFIILYTGGGRGELVTGPTSLKSTYNPI